MDKDSEVALGLVEGPLTGIWAVAPAPKVWLLLATDPWQYQNRDHVCGIYLTEEAATLAKAQRELDEDDTDEYFVSDYEVQDHVAPSDEEIRAILMPGLEAVAASLDRVRPVMDHWGIRVEFDSGRVETGLADSLEEVFTIVTTIRNEFPGDGDILRIEAS